MNILSPAARFLCCLLLSACSQQQPAAVSMPPPSPRQIPPPLGPYFLDRTDSTCRLELQHAQADAQQGHLTYCLIGWNQYADDLDTLLHGHGIGFRYEPMPCTRDGQCYGYYMDSVITRLHGPAFLPRLKQAARQRFLAAWRTRTYRDGGLDVPPQGSRQDLDAYLTANLPRPPGWDPRPKRESPQHGPQRQYLSAALTVTRTGQLGAISFPGDSYNNIKATNRRYLPVVQREIRRLIRAAGPWQAGQLAGHPVSATLWVDVTLNPEQMP